jgi:curved DNA-binding protein CbpA
MFFSGGGFPPGAFPPGFGPGGGRGGGGRREEVDNEKLYEILGVAQDASASEIRKAYLRASTSGPRRHPDKGGDPQKFAELQGAYEVLSDPEKRSTYDAGGEEALKGGGGVSQADIFEALCVGLLIPSPSPVSPSSFFYFRLPPHIFILACAMFYFQLWWGRGSWRGSSGPCKG